MRRLIIALVALACACQDSGSTGQLAGPDPDARAAVTGVVVELPAAPLQQTAGLRIVGSLADAPVGSVPLAGAEVKILGRPGFTVEATGVTGADGSFLLDGLEITHALLEVRRDPATGADLSMLLTLVRDATVVAGAKYPVDRQAAIDAVMPMVQDGSAVVCSQNPLPAGTMVFATLGNADGEAAIVDDTHVVAEGDEWLLYVDPTPDAAFEHHVSYFFVHAVSGEVSELPALSWPSLNFIPIWAYTGDLVSFGDEHPLELLDSGGFPDDLDLTLSEDIVTMPDSEDDAEPELAALAQTAGVDPEDFFAVFWAGSTEPWFVIDIMRMREWAFGQGLLDSNQKTILYGESAFDFLYNPTRTIIPSDSDVDTLAKNTAAEIEDLAEKVRARRDAGGDPLLFVFATSHGNGVGQFLVLDDVFRGLGRRYLPKIFGNQLYIDADKILPIQNIPACRVRVAVAACRAKSHILKWYPHYVRMSPLPDVQFYTASGTQPAYGRRLIRAYKIALTEWKSAHVGVYFTRDLIAGATFTPDGDFAFSPTFDAAFTRYDDQGALAAHVGQNRDDRLCFDPGFPDPCITEPPDLVFYSNDDTSITHFHHVGIDPCPQLVHAVTVTNTTDGAVTLHVTAGNHLLATPASIILPPGGQVTVEIRFDCSTQQQFTSPVRIEATGSGVTQTRDIDVTVKFP